MLAGPTHRFAKVDSGVELNLPLSHQLSRCLEEQKRLTRYFAECARLVARMHQVAFEDENHHMPDMSASVVKTPDSWLFSVVHMHRLTQQGMNDDGQLGLDSRALPYTTMFKSVPGSIPASKISCGAMHVLALGASGEVDYRIDV
jgi:hypothetical protein